MSEFVTQIRANIDLSKAKSDMNSFLNQKHKVNVQFDAKGLNGLKTQLDGLGKSTRIKPTVDTSGIKSAQKDFQMVKSLASQISKTRIKIAGLDTSKNSNEISVLQKQLKSMESDYKSLMKTFSGSFNKGQLGNLENIFGNSADKVEQLNAKTKDLAQTMKSATNSFTRFDAIAASNKTELFLKTNTKLGKDLRDTFQDIADRQRNAFNSGESLKGLNKEFRAAVSQAKLAGETGKSITSEFGRAFTQIGQFVGIYGILQKGVNAVRQMGHEVLDVDNAMTDLRMATGASNKEAISLMKTYSQMGKELKAQGTDVAKSATEWMKQGKSIKESQDLAKDSIVLSKIGGMSSEDSTKTITAYMKSYDANTKEVMNFVDKISAIDMESATDVAGLSNAFNEVAANAKNAGVEAEKLLSYAAVIGETTQEGMSSVGTSLNAIFSRMGNIKLSRLKDYENNGEDLSNVETVLRGVGIQLRDSQREFRDFDDVLDDTAGRWADFSKTQQRAVASAFAGTHHMNDFIILMQQYSKAQEYMQIANESSGTSMEKFNAYQESMSGKIEGFKNQFQDFSSTALDSNFLKGAIDAGTGLLNVFTQIIDVGGGIPTLLGVIGGTLATKNGWGKHIVSNIIVYDALSCKVA